MANRYRIFRRGGTTYYLHDSQTGKQRSLSTRSRQDALRVLHAHEEGRREPNIARQIARAYLHAADPGYAVRTWKAVAEQITSTKKGSTLKRWLTALKDPSLGDLWPLIVVETRPEAFFAALNGGTVSINVYLRRLHNYALDMTWILPADHSAPAVA